MNPTLRMAISATTHCLIGCGIGEVLGMVVGSLTGMSAGMTVALAVTLAFVFGYGLSLLPLSRANMPLKDAMKLVLAADTLSIVTMEIVDNAVILAIPGAIHMHPTSGLFWAVMALALAVAFIVTVPVNYYLLRRGLGHALMGEHHGHHR